MKLYFTVIFSTMVVLVSMGCGETPIAGIDGAAGNGGTAGDGGDGGDGGGGGRDCEAMFDDGAAFLAVDVEDFDGASDLAFTVDGCVIEPSTPDHSCGAEASYFLRVPTGRSTTVVDSPQGLRWRISMEATLGECLSQDIRLADTTTMFLGFGIGDGDVGRKVKFPVDVLVDGEVVGRLERLVDDEELDEFLRRPFDLTYVIPDLYQMQSKGYLVVIPINDVPHFVSYDDFGMDVVGILEGWMAINLFR